jgi:hypothetical protein
VCGLLATILALAALLVALRHHVDEQNPVVELVTGLADAISGPFSRDEGVLSFQGENAAARNALLNWGIAAVVYLFVGRLLALAIAPRSAR